MIARHLLIRVMITAHFNMPSKCARQKYSVEGAVCDFGLGYRKIALKPMLQLTKRHDFELQ